MPGFVAAPNIIKVECRWVIEGQKVENVFHVDNLAAPNLADLTGVHNLFESWLTTDAAPLVSTNATVSEIATRDLSSIDGLQYIAAPASPIVGGFGGTSLPNNCTVAVSWRTTSGGRSGHGRSFWIGMTRNHQGGVNTLASSVASDILDACNNLIADITEAGKRLVVVSYRSGGGPRVGGPVYFEITSAIFTDTTFDSQRRRLPGRGA